MDNSIKRLEEAYASGDVTELRSACEGAIRILVAHGERVYVGMVMRTVAFPGKLINVKDEDLCLIAPLFLYALKRIPVPGAVHVIS